MTYFTIIIMEPLSKRMFNLHVLVNTPTCRYRPLYIGTINPLWRTSEDQELTMKVREVEGVEPSPVFAASGAVNSGYLAEDEYDSRWSASNVEKSAYWMSQVSASNVEKSA